MAIRSSRIYQKIHDPGSAESQAHRKNPHVKKKFLPFRTCVRTFAFGASGKYTGFSSRKLKNSSRRSQRILQFRHHPRNLIKRFRILVGITQETGQLSHRDASRIIAVSFPRIPTPVYTRLLTKRVAGFVIDEKKERPDPTHLCSSLIDPVKLFAGLPPRKRTPLPVF